MQTTVYIAYNERGDFAASVDRDSALDELFRTHGPGACRVSVVYVTVPAIVDSVTVLDLPPGKPEANILVEAAE